MLFVPLYILSIGLSAGVVGVFGRRILAGLGYVPEFSAGLMLATAIACGFAAVQLLYMAMLRFLKPTHSGVPFFAEMVSNLGALALLPYLVDMALPMPPQVPEKLEFVVFVAVFALVHGFFKLVSFFGATKAQPAERVASVGWFVACAVVVVGSLSAAQAWHQALAASHAAALSAEEMARVGGASIQVRRVREKAFTTIDLAGRDGRDVLLGWLDPAGGSEKDREVYVALRPDLPEAGIQQEVVPLDRDGWALLRLDDTVIPPEAAQCTVMWSTEQQPAWVTEMGLRPADASEQEMMVWGPRFPKPSRRGEAAGIIVVLIEGVSSEQVSFQGYTRQTTPRLDAFAATALAFDSAYTLAPEGPALAWSLLTGVSPLAHGALAGHAGDMPEGVVPLARAFQAKGYLTAAFTEGEEPGNADLYYGCGLEDGFDWYDPAYPTERSRGQERPGATGPRRHGGSWHTLRRAVEWIQARGSDPFFVVLRLSELREPVARGRYGRGYMGQQVNPRGLDIHDTALRHVDEQVGRFLDEIGALPDSESWAIAIAGTHGLDFTEPGRGTWRRDGPGVAALSESGLHVPLLLRVPGTLPARRTEMVSIESLTPTLLALADLKTPQRPRGQNLLDLRFNADPVAVTGNPLELALRTRKWLFTWNTGLDAYTGKRLHTMVTGEIFDVERYRSDLAQVPQSNYSTALSDAFRKRLLEYLQGYLAVDENTLDLQDEAS